uniref:TMV resistance protein N-like n=1 Tax=Erigeron canadensis TaxID=72917 RepID=UPI001CB89B74|nr:TMV resistance protein N-like [Erigeron canadensis]
MSSFKEVRHMEISFDDIELATNKFSEENVIGSGGFGKVYRGESEQHGTIAVKWLDRQFGQGDTEFMMEISLLSVYKHPNIISLVGFCDKDPNRFLVYKHEKNGSLDKYLRSKELTWMQRLQVCIDAARGLKYLHNDVGPQHRILHRDIKSANILLDENWRAKIADFGLSKVGPANVECTFMVTDAAGTQGYLDPENLKTGVLTTKTDVFAFGVVLFEVLSAKPVLVFKQGEDPKFLYLLAKTHYETDTLKNIILPDLKDQIDTESLRSFSSIAYRCLGTPAEDRPTMSEILEELEEAMYYQLKSTEACDVPVNSFINDGDKSAEVGLSSRLSSASSSKLSSASSSMSPNHNVYITFGGDDIVKTFIDTLCSAFEQQGIHTCINDPTLSADEPVDSSLLKAIDNSQVAIIVFSKVFLSPRFLDDVAYIMKCMEEKGKIVKPVFYTVEPSQFREEIRSFVAQISELELENGRESGSWKKALIRASKLSGWVPKYFANWFGTKCISRIVDTVSLGLLPAVGATNLHTYLVGIEARMKHLKSLMEIGSGGCSYGWNMGDWGWGKKMLNHVLKPKQVIVKSIDDGKRIVKSRLCNIKFLIVLDDVDDLQQLEGLVGSQDWFGQGSRIIITTRNEDVLKAHKVSATYTVSLLNQKEAIELFSRHAFGPHKYVEYDRLIPDVVSMAEGLPLALKIWGSHLSGLDMSEWMMKLANSSIPLDEVIKNLRISYDGLKFEEKELFLDIACLIASGLRHTMNMILDACDLDYVKMVNVLKQKALVTSSHEMLFMHNLVKEMGIYINQEEHKNSPQKQRRFWRKEYLINKSAMDAPEVDGTMMNVRWISYPGYPASLLPAQFKPAELRCLILTGSLQKQLWEGPKDLPRLKVLNLDNSKYLTITPDIEKLPCLERMTLRGCESLETIHPSIGRHEGLVFVDFHECSKVKMFPPITRMKRLKTLILTRCSSLGKFPKIERDMDSLEILCLDGTGIKVLPSSVGIHCTKLVYIDLRSCLHLKSIEGNFRELKSLKELHLNGCQQLGKLDEDFFDVENRLDVLSLSLHDTKVTNVLSGVGLRFSRVSMKFPHFPRFLKKLSLRNCNLIDEDIPFYICEMSSLKVLDIRGNNFSRIHSAIAQLTCLKFLDVSHCKNLVKLPVLPSSIAILDASCCDSLEIVEDLSKSCKWLWKVSLWRKKKLTGVERVIHAMLQGSATQDYYLSLILGNFHNEITTFPGSETFTLRLPINWDTDFSGFLIRFCNHKEAEEVISIREELHVESECSLPESDLTPKIYPRTKVAYISFNSLRNTSWWNSAYTKLSFSLRYHDNIKVELISSEINEGDPVENAEGATGGSEYWDKEVESYQTFSIKRDSKSCIEISWNHESRDECF